MRQSETDADANLAEDTGQVHTTAAPKTRRNIEAAAKASPENVETSAVGSDLLAGGEAETPKLLIGNMYRDATSDALDAHLATIGALRQKHRPGNTVMDCFVKIDIRRRWPRFWRRTLKG